MVCHALSVLARTDRQRSSQAFSAFPAVHLVLFHIVLARQASAKSACATACDCDSTQGLERQRPCRTRSCPINLEISPIAAHIAYVCSILSVLPSDGRIAKLPASFQSDADLLIRLFSLSPSSFGSDRVEQRRYGSGVRPYQLTLPCLQHADLPANSVDPGKQHGRASRRLYASA